MYSNTIKKKEGKYKHTRCGSLGPLEQLVNPMKGDQDVDYCTSLETPILTLRVH